MISTIVYVGNAQKRPELFYAIRNSFASTTSSDKRFRRGVSNCPGEENTRSYSADIAGIECIFKAH